MEPYPLVNTCACEVFLNQDVDDPGQRKLLLAALEIELGGNPGQLASRLQHGVCDLNVEQPLVATSVRRMLVLVRHTCKRSGDAA